MVLLTEDENGEGEAMGVVIFRGEEREEATQLHSAEGRRHNKECVAAKEVEGGGRPLEVKDDQRKLGPWSECAVGPSC
jgi:hypothetical protein